MRQYLLLGLVKFYNLVRAGSQSKKYHVAGLAGLATISVWPVWPVANNFSTGGMIMSTRFSRRTFLGSLAAGGAVSARLPWFSEAAAATGKGLPHRPLGRTGALVSILAFGCGSRFLMYQDEEQALAVLNHAIDLGIDYLDTAYSYGDGESETRVGKVMATRRKEVWLATKISDRTRDAFLRRLEGSLKRLQTDHVDLVHIHSLGKADMLAKIEAPDGAIRGLMEAKEQNMARFIGMTSHTDGPTLAQAIERHPLDCVQMALNPSGNGGFEKTALPAANKKGLGVIAMKVFGQESLIGSEAGKADPTSLLRFALSLPVATAVSGMPQVDMLERNVALGRNFSPFSVAEMDRLRQELAVSRPMLEKKLVGHTDGPTDHPEAFWA
jgi:diketogulonate reductase-like aldo/keto reductase